MGVTNTEAADRADRRKPQCHSHLRSSCTCVVGIGLAAEDSFAKNRVNTCPTSREWQGLEHLVRDLVVSPQHAVGADPIK